MAQDFIINGVTLDYIMTGDWIDTAVDSVLDGQTVHNRYRPHIWLSNVQTVANFNTLYALEGQQVTITTTNQNDKNVDFIQYFGVLFKSINAQHAAKNLEQVRCEFLVRL